MHACMHPNIQHPAPHPASAHPAQPAAPHLTAAPPLNSAKWLLLLHFCCSCLPCSPIKGRQKNQEVWQPKQSAWPAAQLHLACTGCAATQHPNQRAPPRPSPTHCCAPACEPPAPPGFGTRPHAQSWAGLPLQTQLLPPPLNHLWGCRCRCRCHAAVRWHLVGHCWLRPPPPPPTESEPGLPGQLPQLPP